jgi:RNA polymerase subunit RPABC4/transcription elongation factor Spt4
MKTNNKRTRICPICGKTYTEWPALSRVDNLTLICPDCGTRQALENMGVSSDETEEIIAIIHRNS